MKNYWILFLSIFIGTNLNGQCYNLVWADEFDGTNLDLNKWSYQTGAGGWGNNELQYYTDSNNNAYVSSGSLKIEAKEESFNGANYTSARIRTIGQGDWTYGKMEASIKLPEGQGIWPAFWMMPTESAYGGWPTSGEIDIMEYLGHQTNSVYGTCHFGNSPTDKSSSGNWHNISPDSFADGEYHHFMIEWEPTQIRWYADGILYHTFNASDVGNYPFPFDQDFHFILNIAVGGNWPGNPDNTTVFPQMMEVDYVRVYQQMQDISLTGDFIAEPNQSGVVYQVPDMPNTTYTWHVPYGSTIVSGLGTHEVVVDWGTYQGIIAVTVDNDCGNIHLFEPVTLTANQTPNPGFENNLNHWYPDNFNGAYAAWNIDTSNPHNESKSMCADVTAVSPNVWDVQISPELVDLIAGEEYTLTFWAKANTSGKAMSIALIHPTNYTYYTGTGYTLTNDWVQYSHIFTATVTGQASVNIQFGHETGIFCLDDFFFARTAAMNQVSDTFINTVNRPKNLPWPPEKGVGYWLNKFKEKHGLD